MLLTCNPNLGIHNNVIFLLWHSYCKSRSQVLGPQQLHLPTFCHVTLTLKLIVKSLNLLSIRGVYATPSFLLYVTLATQLIINQRLSARLFHGRPYTFTQHYVCECTLHINPPQSGCGMAGQYNRSSGYRGYTASLFTSWPNTFSHVLPHT